MTRFTRLLREHPGAAPDLFTAVELASCAGKRRRVEHLAARFAAKEAVLKTLTHTADLAIAQAAAVRGPNADVSWLAGDSGTKAKDQCAFT